MTQATHNLLRHIRAHVLIELRFFGFFGQNLRIVIRKVAAQLQIIRCQPFPLLLIVGAQGNAITKLKLAHAPAATQCQNLLFREFKRNIEHHISLIGLAN